jgi:general nucleoside transport system permease protein
MTGIPEKQAGQAWLGGSAQPGRANRPAPARLRIEKRAEPSKAWQFISVLIALLGALAASAVLIAIAGADVRAAFAAMWAGAAGSPKAVAETLVQATPLIYTGLAVTVAFRARLWNIGGEGQFFAGAMGATWFCLYVGASWPMWALIPGALISGMAFGAVLGLIPAVLKLKYGASEVIVTVMLNFIVVLVMSYLLTGPWKDPFEFSPKTMALPDASHFPVLFAGTRLTVGFVLALVVAGLVYVFLWKTALGYEIRAFGLNPTASKYKGIDVARVTLLVFAISAAIAAMAGVNEVPGMQDRLRPDISKGFGFTGIIIAMLGGLHPAGVILAAIFFGGLTNAASGMQVATGVPVAVADAIQGVTLVFLLIAQALGRYRLRRVRDHE